MAKYRMFCDGLQQWTGNSWRSSLLALHVKDSKVNMIITDYSMPGMSGFDLLKKIKGSPMLKEIPVAIVSSENVPTRIKKCLEEGTQSAC
ncbi:hypothetical protein Leryth_018523 [Lithospermum erythrorhizon]|nr:hypothetical protein Leryth_018523 [Lithospermum erythrorhizon]